MLMVRSLGPGGTERQVAEIAKSLSPHCFQAHVGCFEDGGFRAEELRKAGIPILAMRMRSFLSLDSAHVFRQMSGYIRAHGIRLVHTFDFPMNILCAPVAQALAVPVVLSSQRSHRELVPAKYLAPLRISDHLVDGIVVNCEAVRKHLREDYGIADERITTCYNAIDTERFDAEGRSRPPELAGASVVVGVVCVLRAVKNLETLIQAFAASADAKALLVIVGDGPEEPMLRKLAAELGVAERTLFVPGTSDVAHWLRAIDIFVLPSISEALSNALMEAMACGCFAIASRVGGNPELVSDGVTGLLFEAGNAADLTEKLRTAMAPDYPRERMAAAGACKIATGFSRERSIATIEELYRRELERRGERIGPGQCR